MKKRILALMLILALVLQFCPAYATDGAGDDAQLDGYIVKLREDLLLPMTARMADGYIGFGMYVVDSPEEANALAGSGAVEYVAPNYRVYLHTGVRTPVNDEYYELLQQWNIDHMKVDKLWALDIYGEGIKIAVIDSGLNAAHVDLDSARMLTSLGKNTAGGTVTEDTSDIDAHGTAVSGVIAATANNGKGIAGVAPLASIVPFMAFEKVGSNVTASISDIIAAISEAVNAQVDVINMSIGGPREGVDVSGKDPFEEAINKAIAKGIVLVASSGNDGDGDNAISYPAYYPSMISVGALGTMNYQQDVDKTRPNNAHYTDEMKNTIAAYSTYNDGVWVVAPGTAMITPASVDGDENGSFDDYYAMNGTSFSAPCVSAVAALVKSYRKDITQQEFKNLLMITARHIAASGDTAVNGYTRNDKYGYGAVDGENIAAHYHL